MRYAPRAMSRASASSRRLFSNTVFPATWITLAVALVLLLGGRIVSIAQGTARRGSSLEAREWDLGQTAAGPMRAVVLLPRRRAPGERFPLLIALHGRGEALRGVARGAWGWAQDYGLGISDAVLRRGRLSREAFLGLVRPERLATLQDELRRRPYQGLVVVTPYTPDVLPDVGGTLHQAFERWVLDTLVPRARATLPVIPNREATGIDGVSLGGLHALWIGLAHPEVFGAVGALQPAVRDRQDEVAARYVYVPGRPAQRIRLVTSDRDVLRDDVLTLSERFRARGIVHDLRVLVGPHDYVFNRGPGGIEMLLFHDRALRGEQAP